MTWLYRQGHVTELQHRALMGWLDDGRAVRSRKPRRMIERQRSERRGSVDIMAEAAATRYKTARKRLEAIGVLDDLERAVADEVCDVDKAKDGHVLLVAFYGMRG